ncbi:MAG: MSMEG_4193 family putative phosphomutase [Chloroflexi bacterium]|nr:MSMEG_4193 family putative phosphomutase [Chloroflexota bacterium]
MATIILVRHGENDWVKKHRLAGRIPGVCLNENGHKQAAAAAQRLVHLPVTAVYSSPITRCMETADYIAQTFQLNIIPEDNLGEVRYGRWEGKKIKKLARKKRWFTVQFFPSRMQFPDGESLREVQFRAIQALETLNQQHPEEIIVVVSHADLIKLVLAHYLGVHIDLFQRLTIAPASISVIALAKQGGVRILRINDNGPLEFPPKIEKEKKAASTETAADSQNSPSRGHT